ncbi:transposase family protein [Kitasatospora sp. NPDC101157]|uniref:transposase family protein n=1 Tax=Kitasatospora sp. NPDC101157 TaxID=3364098 RepID=UPI00380A3827
MSQSWSWFGELLFPSLPQVEVVGVEASGSVVRIAARAAAPDASCPDCGAWSERVHGSYLRYPSDLPSCGRPVTVVLRVRRFACHALVCRRRTFVEQVDGLTRRHGQVTERQRSSVAGLGLAPAGRAGARMAELLGIRASRSTLLRRVTELPDPAVGAPVAVGVDDFALRKGHTYGDSDHERDHPRGPGPAARARRGHARPVARRTPADRGDRPGAPAPTRRRPTARRRRPGKWQTAITCGRTGPCGEARRHRPPRLPARSRIRAGARTPVGDPVARRGRKRRWGPAGGPGRASRRTAARQPRPRPRAPGRGHEPTRRREAPGLEPQHCAPFTRRPSSGRT